jgi:hypothetical protein
MATEADYQATIKDFTWGDLDALWTAIKQQNTPGWDRGKALEYLILRSFQLDKAEIRWPYSVRFQLSREELEQIDGVIYIGELACLAECKDYNDENGKKKNINFEPVAKMRNQLMRRPSSTIGSIFSSGGFTGPALTLANFTFPQTILLWNGEEIEYCLKKRTFCQALITKYRKCIEFGLHDYDITIEEEL